MNDNEIGINIFQEGGDGDSFPFIEQYKTKLWIMHMEMYGAVVTLTPEI